MIGTIGRGGYAWTRRRAEELVQTGDLVEVRVGKTGADGVFEATLEQPPALEGAVLAIDNHTGQVMAMIGGASFDRTQFNRAMQAMRQVGSLFKPFVYMAAIDRGYTAASTLADVPSRSTPAPGQPPYSRRTTTASTRARSRLRRALETVAQHARRCPDGRRSVRKEVVELCRGCWA